MATVSAGGDLVAALDRVFASNPQSVATAFCHLLSRIFANVLELPKDEARRKLHTTSSSYQQRIGSVKESEHLLRALGYLSGEGKLMLPEDVATDTPFIQTCLDLFRKYQAAATPGGIDAKRLPAAGSGSGSGGEHKGAGEQKELKKAFDVVIGAEEAVARLSEMGFTVDQASKAFKDAGNDFNSAVVILTRQPSTDQKTVEELMKKWDAEEKEAKKKQLENEERSIKLMLDEAMRSGQRLTLEQNNIRLMKDHTYGKEYTCNVCYSDYKIEDIVVLGCRHFLCKDCMKGHLTACIDDGKSKGLKCAEPSCKREVELYEVEYCVSGATLRKHQEFLLQAHLVADKDCRWCPKPKCATPMLGSKEQPMMVCPKCRFKFCFNCKTEEWHAGSTCEAYQRWKKENAGAEGAFETWLKSHKTGRCPHCNAVFTKPSGCPSMMCGMCKKGFTWSGAYDPG